MNKQFSSLTNDELDRVIKIYKRLCPNSGLRYTTGFLHRHGLQVQQERICMSLQRVDGLGHALRWNEAIMRGTYISQMSNAVWHLDGLHKLIQYGFVIHGTIDGHDHTVSKTLLSINHQQYFGRLWVYGLVQVILQARSFHSSSTLL